MDVNYAWKSTCKALLGEEVGELKEYEKYLLENNEPIFARKSSVSGKPVFISDKNLPGDAKFVSMDEIEFLKGKMAGAAIGINSIKDIDSAIGALKENFVYCGNLVLGNCSNVEASDACANAHFIYACHDLYDGKYAAYSSNLRYGEFVFGSQVATGNFLVKAMRTLKSSRCLEVFRTHYSQDCYYVANLEGCSDCFFSFNLRNKRNCIGNLELPKEEYVKRKAELLGQIRDELKRKKRLPGILEIIGAGNPAKRQKIALPQEPQKQVTREQTLEKLENAFRKTTLVLFGKGLSGMQDYTSWLEKHVDKVLVAKSSLSGKEVYLGGWHFSKGINSNTCTLEESLELGKQHISHEEALGLSLASAKTVLSGINCTSGEALIGSNFGIEECNSSTSAEYCFRGTNNTESRYCAYCLWPRNSEYAFGCSQVMASHFCMHCYKSENLTRCFEVSNSYSCSDCYFCHHCENVRDAIFCFNAKNLSYAIGNVEVGRESYMKAKAVLQAYVLGRLERDNALGMDIYNVGARKGKGQEI